MKTTSKIATVEQLALFSHTAEVKEQHLFNPLLRHDGEMTQRCRVCGRVEVEHADLIEKLPAAEQAQLV